MKLESKDIEEIQSSNIVQQTSFWARLKDRQGIRPHAFRYKVPGPMIDPRETDSLKILDDLLVLVRYLDHSRCYAYVPYGPKDEPAFENYGPFLEELSELLRSFLPRNCILIRYDLPWENQWAADRSFYDEKGEWVGPPTCRNQEFRVNFNTRYWNLVKSRSDNLPTNTIFLNLNRDPEALLRGMKPKTRYNVRLSNRKGVRVAGYGMEMLDTWYGLYRETALRNRITLHPKEFFYSVLESQDHRNVDTRLLMADHRGEYLAAMFLVISRKRATYLYGASSSRKRHLMATYALQWEAIRKAREAGCEEYDMFGVAPNRNTHHPLQGLHRFKSGFGGSHFHRMGCWDYPIDESSYKIFRAREIQNPSYHRT